MATRLLVNNALRKTLLQLSRGPQVGSVAGLQTVGKIGKREVVGYGWNGTNCYLDRVDYPYPAIRFREDNEQIKALRVKEKQDWKNLTKDEIKTLYRASFCQTFAEVKAPTGFWKHAVGIALLFISGGIWLSILMNIFIYDELPESFSEENRREQLKRMIDLEVNPVNGLTSKWDYENNCWKK